MNYKRFFISSFVLFIYLQILDFVFHGMLMAKTYAALQHLWRADMPKYMWIMTLGSLILSFAFTYFFIRGRRKSGAKEGLKFGIAASIFLNVPASLGSFAMYPLPLSLAAIWITFGFVQYISGAILVSLIYRPKS